jgi:hypothetical protein
MPRPNLSAMSVDALLKLRDDINKILDRKAGELRSQLSMLGVAAERRRQASSLKGKKVPPKYRSPSVRLGQAVVQDLFGLLLRSRVERSSMIS